MKELRLIKVRDGFRMPYQSDLDRVSHIQDGTMVFAKIKQPRNPEYLSRFFCMLKLAYDYWDPALDDYKGLPAVKDPDQFREDVTIAAGYCTSVVHLDGSITHRAMSIAFDNMGEEQFQKLYKSVFNVLWEQFLRWVPGMTEEEAHNAISQLMTYE